MAKQVRLHQLEDLALNDLPKEIILQTDLNTELHIIADEQKTILRLPFGNKFDIVDSQIIIYPKS